MVKNLILCTLICILVILVGCGKSTAEYINSEDILVSSEEEIESETITASETTSEEPQEIFVYVCGAVVSPGVYAIPEGSRICNLFQYAGGLTEEAAGDYWNQARILVDGEMIYVPTQEEAKERSDEEWDNAGGLGVSQGIDEGKDKKININTASIEELMTLPGIGESKALAILEYREEKGAFSSVEDLKEIPGIKDGVFAKIKKYITIN